ncbi:exo-alpha-sialidase [Paenibacillus radicis (ex Xue et al. 2023)]|uniref:Exo-alpha-sialidase n=1 Tax=Paenibacillus radicis (ex Xue et al. 2023) TaxID=2972489 RepID=A0ABT1Y9R3_9BACL|nr:exo-alpha-sialidase [Paenibacillus radicis (ex Xue et al. 2023)]MCR8629652.1 exo-alpha-sialidase [Paenibacillus radicis (ex Xue et al. 2023)]
MKIKRRISLLLFLMMTFSLFQTVAIVSADPAAMEGIFKRDIFPYHNEHNHGPSMVELKDGTLFAVWFRGEGERDANNTRLMGARSKDGGKTWTAPFLVYDTYDFPDINPVLFVDSQDRLWLFYYIVLNGQWVSSQPRYMYADLGSYEYDITNGSNPKWHYPEVVYMNVGDTMSGAGSYANGQWNYRIKGSEIRHVLPSKVTAATPLDPSKYVEVTSQYNPSDIRYVTDSFVVEMKNEYDKYLNYLTTAKPYDDVYAGRSQEIADLLKNGKYVMNANGIGYSTYEPPIIKNSIERAAGADNDYKTWNPAYNRMGWQTKNKPLEIDYNGKKRLLLPLYSDSLANSVFIYTDDRGATWQISEPVVGSGTIQGSMIQLTDGTVRAYFRSGKLDGRNGRLAWHVSYSESKDGGATWSTAKVDPYLKNDGGFEFAKLANGDWLALHNQEVNRDLLKSGHRNSVSLSLSKDEGKTWKSILIDEDPLKDQTYQYPSVIVGSNNELLMIYSHHSSSGKTMGFARVEASEMEKLFGATMTASNAGVAVGQSLNMSTTSSKQLTVELTVDGVVRTDGGNVWSSDTPAVASVDQTGTITAKKAGTALIYVKSVKYGTLLKCLVTVTDAP